MEYTLLEAFGYTFYAAKDAEGLCIFDNNIDACFQRFPQAQHNTDAFHEVAAQLSEYEVGIRHTFNIPLHPQGTAFQMSVWKVLSEIPCGEVWTYSDVAQKIENPKGVRAVGGAIGKNPLMLFIPCHRVIGKSGKLVGFTGGLDLKQILLNHEGGHYGSKR